MATEQTLGKRIMEVAVGLSCAGNRATVDRSMAKLRALAARADAAERLARCCHELNNIDFDDYLEALAAWRAITKSEVPS